MKEKPKAIASVMEHVMPGCHARAAAGLCVTCGAQIDMDSFRDELSIREYHISGMCQDCQDDVFGK